MIIAEIRPNCQQNELRRQNMARFPILMYHRILSAECPIPREAVEEFRYSLSLEEFARQLERMVSSGYRGVAVGDALDAASADESVPDNWVVLTFDDGNRSDYVHALPLLQDKGFTATFFIGTSRIGCDGGLEAGMIGELAAGGMEIGSHGMSHRFLPSLSGGEEVEECVQSKRILAELAGRDIHYFALPGGRYNRRTVRTLKRCGYSAVCTSKYGYNSQRPSFLLKRIPIHSGTARTTFDAVLRRSIARLIPGYCRTTAAQVTRNIIGERMYSKLRAVGLRG
jgi:peptidoglycan/xylan/chitin deacetylase (PgdA/CDA1 family)